MTESKNWTKFPTLLSLYIAQSVPMSFFSTVVPVIMRQENYSLESIGLLQLVKLPWIIKFFWAPLVDNSAKNSKDLKRWIVFSELFYAVIITSIAFLSLQTDFKLIIVLMVVAFTASATQDIATDAFSILVLKKDERGLGNSMQTAGSFVGALLGTGVLLIAYSFFGWSAFLFMLAGFIIFALVPLYLYKVDRTIEKKPGYRVTLPEIGRFFRVPGIPKRVLILVFYYSGFIGILTMLKPFLVDLGYNIKEIGFMSGIVGTSVATGCALLVGALIKKTGRNRIMIILSILSITAALYFWLIAEGTPSLTQIYIGICLVWGAYGASTVIIYTTSMDAVRPGAAGTDFTVQIVITHVSSLAIAVSSGKVAGLLGYKGLFGVEVLMGILTLLIILYAMPRERERRRPLMKIDPQILEKYNVAVPRYTSYPPANHFTGGFTSADQQELLVRSNSWQPEHIALYVHIPFCKKICFYCGCNACKLNSAGEVRSYIDALKKEIVMAAQHIDKSRRVTQLHFGGGTPNAIPAEMLTEIVELFRSLFTFTGSAEIAIETNPAYLDKPYLDALLQAGFNRFSFGIQDFNNDVLKMVNREPSAMPVAELIDYVKNAGTTVNLDFIYGLPGQTVESFTKTMQQAAELRPDRLVTFSYAHVPWLKKHQQILEKRGLPGPEEKTDMFLAGYNQMKNAGYEPIGLDHFVKKEDELYRALENKQLHRNFQGYCTRGTTGQVYAFGVTAISQLEKAYLQNTKSIKEYISEIDNNRFPVEKGMRVSDDQLIIREVITQLMCNKQLHWSDLAASIGMTADQLKTLVGYDPAKLEGMGRDGLLGYDDKGLWVTETGSMFIRNIAVLFDPAFSEQVNRYSKSV